MRRWWVAVLGIGVGIGAACSTFSGAPADETADGGDAALDGSVDAARDDAAVGDAVAEADAPVPVPPCPAGAFCDDFERTASLAQGWSDVTNSMGTTLTLSSTRVLSGSGALRLDVESGSGSPAFLRKNITGSPAKTMFSFSVYLDAAPELDIVVAVLNLGGPTVYVVALPQGKLGIADQVVADGGTMTKVTSFDIGIGKWRDVEVTYTSATAMIEWKVDGVRGGRPATYASGQVAYLAFGAGFVRPGHATSFHFDHLVLQTQ